MKMFRIMGLTLFLITGCATSSGPGTTDPGIRKISRYTVLYEGPEMDVALGFHHATRSIGEEWLVVAVEFTAGSRGGRAIVDRSDISVFSPTGRRLALVGQEEFRENYGAIRVAIEQALRSLPIIGRYDPGQLPCDRWFLRGPSEGFANDVISVNTFQLCSGPLVFRVSGGVQPGRWRLVIELEESRADIPFELEVGE